MWEVTDPADNHPCNMRCEGPVSGEAINRWGFEETLHNKADSIGIKKSVRQYAIDFAQKNIRYL